MAKKIFTWVHPDGSYHVTSPGYSDFDPDNETEAEFLERKWARHVEGSRYHDILILNPPRFIVDDDDQRVRLAECCGTYFRYGGAWDAKGKCHGKDGAWEMDTDGRPKVNMAKARGVHMDKIRIVRNAELAAKDITFMRAVEVGDTSGQAAIATEKQVLRDIPQTFDLTTDTPLQLKAKWPTELPARE